MWSVYKKNPAFAGLLGLLKYPLGESNNRTIRREKCLLKMPAAQYAAQSAHKTVSWIHGSTPARWSWTTSDKRSSGRLPNGLPNDVEFAELTAAATAPPNRQAAYGQHQQQQP